MTSPGEVVAPGDQITVKVLRVDNATQKISLGLKQLQGDPWTTVASTYEVGQVRTGRVTRVADFGAFVELDPGIEGLAHASTFAPTGRPGGWAKSVTVGSTGAFEILSIDTAQKRIGIALVDEGSARAASAQGTIAPGTIVTGKVERHEKFGVFVFLSPGRTGLLPLTETGVDRDADMLKAFPIGSDVEVAGTRGRSHGPPHSPQQEGSVGRARARGTAGVRREAGQRAGHFAGIAGRQPAKRAEGSLRPTPTP